MAWAGLGASAPGRGLVWRASSVQSSVRFPLVVLQDDQRLAEAKSSSPGCQLSIATPLLVRPRVSRCHKLDAARNAGAKGSEASMANVNCLASVCSC
ncbi:hypothetical protein CCMA1212_008942 [Trichoderma ghanense]|uniref:Secreted protein n=1 Tax=Trichoderma ghanense TaxID=65468 RepID=A0ABY2GTD9_9HYPO